MKLETRHMHRVQNRTRQNLGLGGREMGAWQEGVRAAAFGVPETPPGGGWGHTGVSGEESKKQELQGARLVASLCSLSRGVWGPTKNPTVEGHLGGSGG